MTRGRRGAAATGIVAAVLCASAAPAAALDEDPGWTLVLAEDFERIDPERWTLKDETYSSNEDSFLRAGNCSIADAGADGNALRLQAEEEPVRRWGDTWDYTSCYATTEGKYSLPDHFRVEVRAKVPMEQGMWAAPLWLRPGGDAGGEIDVAETLGGQDEPRLSQTIHTGYGPEHAQSSYDVPFSSLDDPTGTGWHTYTVEKVPGRLTMWADGVQTAQWSTGDPAWFTEYYDAGKRWSLRVNLQVGGRWGGRPDRTTDWSRARTAMLVDHIRVWTPTVPSTPPNPIEGEPARVDGDEGEARPGSWLQRALALLVPDLSRSLP